MTGRDETIGIRAHGVLLNLASGSRQLLDDLTRLVPGLMAPPSDAPDLEVHAHWLTGPMERGRSWFSDAPALASLGKRMRVAEDELVWFGTHRDRDLQLRFRRSGGRPAFDVAYCFQPKRKKQEAHPDLAQRKLFELLRYVVLFPIAWHLERTRGWSLIHASAVAAGDRAVLVAGPGGAGKTTTSLALAARSGMALLCDNLLFSDGSSIHPVDEPIRVTADSLALVGEELRSLEPIGVPGAKEHKSMFRLARRGEAPSARATAIFLLRFSGSGFARRVEPAVAFELLGAANRLTLELSDYHWYASALDLLWPHPGRSRRALEVVERLTATTPCWMLGIERVAGVGPVVDRILCCLDAETEKGSS